MSRINLQDNMMDVVTKMAEGNPGAIMSIMEVMDKHDAIDPQAFMGGLGAIMILDTWGIYGSNIYILFNDKCGRDVRKFLILQRACQLGHLPESRLKELASDPMGESNITKDEWQELDSFVCERLNYFQRPNKKPLDPESQEA